MRFKLCTLIKNDKVETAYIKEEDAKIDKVINGWKITQVSVNSVTEETLKTMRITKVDTYEKEYEDS